MRVNETFDSTLPSPAVFSYASTVTAVKTFIALQLSNHLISCKKKQQASKGCETAEGGIIVSHLQFCILSLL